MNNNFMKKRIIYAIAFVLLVALEVVIALFVRDSFIRPYGGDIIVIVVLYCFVRIIFPEKFTLLPLYLFSFAVCVEIAQAFDYVTLLGLGNIRFFRVLLGSSFSWYDIICYAAGSTLCLVVQLFTLRKKERNQSLR